MVLVLSMACMVKDSVSVFDKVIAVEFVVGSDVVIMVIKLPLIDRIVATRKIYLDHIPRESPLEGCG